MTHSWRRRLRQLRRSLRYGRHAPTVRKVVLYGGGALLGLSVIWLVVTGLYAKTQISKLETRISQVKALVAAGQIDQARQVAEDVPTMARRAHHLTTGPVWWVASHVPYFGEPLDVVRATTVATQQVCTDAIPQLLKVATIIDPNHLRASGRTIRVGPLAAAAPQLDAAARAIDDTVATVNRLPADTWLSSVNAERGRLTKQLGSIRGYVDAAARVAKALPDMLGNHGPQRYFIGLQNEAEMRGTGGLPGAFAIATVDHGTITFNRFESDAALLPPGNDHRIKTGLDFGPEYDALYGPSAPTETFVDSNVSPHFPYAAQIWAAMWQKTSGQRIDGVIALDPTALSYFLAATGPAQLPDGSAVDADNVVSLTQRDNYVLFPNNLQRKQFLVAVLKAAAHKLTSGAGAALQLVQAASTSASEQRLLAWSRDPAIERLLKETNYAGAIPTDDRPLSALILNNAAAGKLDYYLVRSLTYTRTGCGSHRDVTVTITLQNNAPAYGLPPYVVSRLDHPPPGAKPGDNHALLDYYATKGALLDGVTLNGVPSTASANTELGHAVFRLDLQLPRGTTQTVVLHLEEPAGTGTPQIWKQPGVTPLAVNVVNQPCG